jgi:hypothetical protein
MPGSFATLAVGDPHDTMQSLSEHFAPPAGETQQYWARTYEAADWRWYKIEPNAYRTLVSVGVIGGVGGQAGLTCLSSFKDQAASKFSIKSPGLDFYYLSFLQEGSVNCANRERKPSWTRNAAPSFARSPRPRSIPAMAAQGLAFCCPLVLCAGTRRPCSTDPMSATLTSTPPSTACGQLQTS